MLIQELESEQHDWSKKDEDFISSHHSVFTNENRIEEEVIALKNISKMHDALRLKKSNNRERQEIHMASDDSMFDTKLSGDSDASRGSRLNKILENNF